MIRLLAIVATVLFVQQLGAQTAEDALRYSYVSPIGTARFAGTGGALTPLGVDFTTMSTNPAGIGWARYSYGVITPGLAIKNIESTLLNGTGNSPSDLNVSQFALPNIGAVFTSETNSVDWHYFNFGVGLNRIADYNETIFFRGRSAGSILEPFAEDANDGIFSDFRNNLAFEAEAIFEGDSSRFVTDIDNNPAGVIRREGRVTRSGSMNEFVLSMGGNFRDKLMWGLTLGIPFMNFTETRTYDEIDDRGEIPVFDDLSFDETLETNGSGVNFKLGVIYRPLQELRVSFAVHSPTFWSINETYETQFSYSYTLDGVAEGGTALSPRSEFAYNLQTPWRLMLGFGSVINKKGFIALDAEYVNYAGNQFSYDDFSEEATAVNEEVDNLLTSAFSLRLGGEYRIDPILVRLGVSAQQYPVEGDDSIDLTFSAGAGYRFDRYFVDFAYQYGIRDRSFQPYSTFLVEPQVVDVSLTQHNFLLSAGVFF